MRTKGKKKMKRLIICALLIASSIACSKVEQGHGDNGEIRLKVGIADTYIDTKAAANPVPYRGTAPTSENPLKAHLFFSDVAGVYGHNPTAPTYLPVRTSITFKDTKFTHPDQVNGINLMYPVGDAPVYCVGIAPGDGKWQISDDNKVISHEIDGSTDLMYAPEITGKWTEHFPVQEYRHAQTWIEIAVCASDVFANDFWGELKSIALESSATMSYTPKTGVLSYSSEKKNIAAFEGAYELKPTIHELGSAFCSPDTELKITINSEKITDKKVSISMPSQSITEMAGKVYVVELFFNSFDVVEGKCSIKPWEYQDENISMK